MSVPHPSGYDRRIGMRIEASDMAMVWRADADDKRRRRRAPGPEAVEVVDLSLTGALVVSAASADDLVVGSTVVIAVDGHRGRVRIRRVLPHADPRRSKFGVSFVDLSPELRRIVEDRIAVMRGPVTESDWLQAH